MKAGHGVQTEPKGSMVMTTPSPILAVWGRVRSTRQSARLIGQPFDLEPSLLLLAVTSIPCDTKPPPLSIHGQTRTPANSSPTPYQIPAIV